MSLRTVTAAEVKARWGLVTAGAGIVYLVDSGEKPAVDPWEVGQSYLFPRAFRYVEQIQPRLVPTGRKDRSGAIEHQIEGYSAARYVFPIGCFGSLESVSLRPIEAIPLDSLSQGEAQWFATAINAAEEDRRTYALGFAGLDLATTLGKIS